jgi:hypothetical protein
MFCVCWNYSRVLEPYNRLNLIKIHKTKKKEIQSIVILRLEARQRRKFQIKSSNINKTVEGFN